MKKLILSLALLISVLPLQQLYAQSGTYQVYQKDIYAGYIVQKIWLSAYAMPQVTITDIGYVPGTELPKDALLSDPNSFEVKIGMERKRPFAVIHIPAYTHGALPGQVNKVSSYRLTINEQPQVKSTSSAARTTNSATSVLASGTWHKIGITKTGFYKIDHAFLTAMGITPANINPANIRVFGNGGNMLSEKNSVPRPTDLLENAVQLNDNGDNAFDNGESVIFYAVGPTGWEKDSVNQRFTHTKNIYTDTAYYFISFDQGTGMRISPQGAVAASNADVTSFNYYDAHDSDAVNPHGIGKLWLGEQFYPQLGNTTQTFSFDMGTTVSDVYIKTSFGSTSNTAGSSFSLSLNGISFGSIVFTRPTVDDDVMTLQAGAWNTACNSQTANITARFSNSDGSSVGFLNYIEINARRNLIMSGDQMNFRDWQSVGAGKIANYQLQGANGNTKVWDVTDPQSPVLMTGSLNGSIYSFKQDAQKLHEFAVMNSNNVFTPKYIGTVANQNLHGSGQVDGIIVTAPEFLDQANQVAEYHRMHDNMRIVVATTGQIYNEFSSGGQDICAIRDFARMFYQRAGSDTAQMPKYLLLFGGASYDYKNRIANNCNYVPVFESEESLNNLSTFSGDDFYGFLDDNENIEDHSLVNVLDVGIGRLPARNLDDAKALVNKIISYTDPATLGPWRISSTHVADNVDNAGDHMADAEAMAEVITEQSNNLYNQHKVYLDAMQNVSTPAGERCPNASASINDNVYKGTFMINYNGHGNPQVWAAERILTQDDYNKWNNANMQPFMVTATCDFGQFDHPEFISSAENLVKRAGGGVIAILTTTQAVYATFNHDLNVQYLESQFGRNENGSWSTFGEANRSGKNVTYVLSKDAGKLSNFRKFALLGDPMLTPDFPQHAIHLDSVTDGFTMLHADTVKALGAYIMHGSVKDIDGHLLTGFNGMLSVSFYDKPRTINTIRGTGKSFKLQDNIVYKGRVSVTNGQFSFTFIAPKDINYYFGAGKISTYASNGITDGAGADTNFVVGGFSDHPQYNTVAPVVNPYINDSFFLNGGITGSNTSLYVSLYSETGINVSGNNVGHDLIGVLDGNKEQPYLLNDFYETAPNTYKRGYINFPVNGLTEGRHSIKVTAWDVNNNMGDGTVDFMVVNGKVASIQNLGTYPNPFNTSTHFVFEHNHPFEQLNVKINIYNIGGASVKDIEQNFVPSGSRSSEITWDGTDNNGIRLASGVYVYRFTIATDKGFKSSAYQKLVIVR